MKALRYAALILAMAFLTTSCTDKEEHKTPPPAPTAGATAPSPIPAPPGAKAKTIESPDLTALGLKSATLWLKASSLKDLKEGEAVTKWKDEAAEGTVLEQPKKEKAPTFTLKGPSGSPAVVFSGAASLHKNGVRTSTFVNNTSGSFFAVVKFDNKKDAAELFGLGDCANNRFLMHLPFKGNIFLFFGSTNVGLPSTSISSSDYHVISGGRDAGDMVGIEVDGANMAKSKVQGALDSNAETTFVLGSSPCGSLMDGQVAEFILTNDSLDIAKRAEINSKLAAKYKIKLKK